MSANPTPLAATLKRSLIERRRRLGMSKLELCRRGRFDRRALDRWEGDETDPSLGCLIRWAAALGLELDLRGGDADKNPA